MSGSVEAFERNLAQVVIGAKLCLDRDLHMPALVLIYSLIDSFAWAASEASEKNTRDRFENWLSRFVYPHSPLPCTPAELYAARCGVLHTFTGRADLHVRGKLRQVVYAWGPARLSTLQESVEITKRADIVGLHINELLDAVANGIEATFKSAGEDARLSANLDRAAQMHYAEIPKETLERLLASAKSDGNRS